MGTVQCIDLINHAVLLALSCLSAPLPVSDASSVPLATACCCVFGFGMLGCGCVLFLCIYIGAGCICPPPSLMSTCELISAADLRNSIVVTVMSASSSPSESPSPREALATLEQRCAHMAAEAATRLSVVTAQQAALAANFTKVNGVVDRLDGVMQLMSDKRVSGVASLTRYLKQSVKQLELWQSAAAVTASQLIAVADLIDDADNHATGRLLDTTVSVYNSSTLMSSLSSLKFARLSSVACSVHLAGVDVLHVKLHVVRTTALFCHRDVCLHCVRLQRGAGVLLFPVDHTRPSTSPDIHSHDSKPRCVQMRPIVTGSCVQKLALQVTFPHNYGLATSHDNVSMVASHHDDTLSVYSLPGGEHIRTFGGRGAGEGQFDVPAKLCFSTAGNILVAEHHNKRVQEVTLTGDHVRFIGVGVIDDTVWSIAANAELVAVGKWGCTSNNRIMMFDAVTGAFMRAFGDHGSLPGQLMKHCPGIRFTPDTRHIVVTEWKLAGNGDDVAGTTGRLSVFTLAGEFVRCIGEGKLLSALDVEFTDNGDVVTCDYFTGRISVFSADGSTLLRQWGGEADADGEFMHPTALAMCAGQPYVLYERSKRVQVFE